MDAESLGFWDSILSNQRGLVAETGRANLYVMDGENLSTPSMSMGLLPGIVRQVLIKRGLAQTRGLSFDDLASARAIFVSNSLIGMAGVTRIQGLKYSPDPDFLLRQLDRFRSACHPNWQSLSGDKNG